jgi:hypothetical protein
MVFFGNCILPPSLVGFIPPPATFSRPAGEVNLIFNFLTLCQHPIFTLLTEFYVHVTVHRNKFLCNKTNWMHQFYKFILSCNSTCFGQFVCPSSLYSQQWYMSYKFVDSCRAGPGWKAVLSWSCSKAVYKPV